MELEGYKMGWGQSEIENARLEAFMRQELTPNEITVLMQDVCEANLLAQLPAQFYHCAAHLVDRRIVSLPGRQTH
jgi:hypothetical protein